MENFTVLDDSNYTEKMQAMGDAVILLHKKTCPHCENMMKVLSRFSAMCPKVQIAVIDSEESPQAKEFFGVERVPALVLIRNGKVVATKVGLMNHRDLAALHDKSR